MSKLILSLAIATFAVAAPAFASSPDTPIANAADGGAAAAAAPVAPGPERRYCVTDQITGSRLPHKVCKTRKEWMAEGFDPLEK